MYIMYIYSTSVYSYVLSPYICHSTEGQTGTRKHTSTLNNTAPNLSHLQPAHNWSLQSPGNHRFYQLHDPSHQWDTSQKVDSRGVEICQGFSRIKTSTLSRSLRVFWRQINGDSWWKLTHIDSWLIPPEIFGNWSARNCCCKMLELPSSTGQGQPWAHGWARDKKDSSQGMVKR